MRKYRWFPTWHAAARNSHVFPPFPDSSTDRSSRGGISPRMILLAALFLGSHSSFAIDGIGEEIAKNTLQRPVPAAVSAAAGLESVLEESEAAAKVLEAKARSGQSLGDGLQHLDSKSNQIESYHRQLKGELDAFRQRLQDLGLSEKARELAAYRKQIDGELEQLKSDLNTAVHTPANQVPAALGDRLTTIRSTLSKRKRESHKPAGADSLPLVFSNPTSTPVAVPAPQNVVFNLNDAPTASDLASTAKVEITPRIKELADKLGNSPVRIYEYVRNNIEYVPYYGSLKNAETVLLSKSGNDYDQATLLIALLRATGIPARYAKAKIMVPIADVKDWLEVKREEVAYNIFSGLGDTSVAMATSDGSTTGSYIGVVKQQVWVVAYVPYGNYRGTASDTSEKRWISLDPTFKTRRMQQGIKLDLNASGLGFDYTNYLSSVKTKTPVEAYEDQVRQFIQSNYAGKSTADVPFRGKIKVENLQVLPTNLPYLIGSLPSTFYDIADDYTHKLKLELTTTGGGLLLDYPYRSISAISNKRLTVSFIAATPQDQAIVDSYGGFDQVPTTAVLNVLPVIKEQGIVVRQGTTSVPFGQDLQLKMTWLDFANGYTTPTSGVPKSRDTTSKLVAGNYLSVLLDVGQASDDFINDRVTKFISAHDAVSGAEKNSDMMMGEMLYIAGMRYAQLLGQQFRAIEDLDNVRIYRDSFHVSTTSMTNRVSYVFGQTPFAVKADGFVIDGKSGYIRLFQLGDWTDGALDLSRESKLAGYTFAALEHQIWEEMTRLVSISTVKGLQLAKENGLVVYDLVPADASTICLMYTVGGSDWCANNPDDVLNSRVTGGKEFTIKAETFKQIKSDLQAGRNVTIPKQTLAFNSWNGEIWITNDPVVHSYAFMISGKTGSSNGGATTTSSPYAPPPPLDPTGTRSLFGDQMDVSPVNGNVHVGGVDFQINGRGMPVSFSRSYNSQLAYDGPMGYGWTHSYNLFLQERDDNANNTPNESADTDAVISSVKLYDGTGSQINFFVAGGAYTNEPGVHSVLTKETTTGLFTITEQDNSRIVFGPVDASGLAKVSKLIDPNGNTVTLEYNGPGGSLDKIKDTVGRQLQLRYTAYAGKQRLTEIEDWTARKWQYGYDSKGNLVSFRHPISVADPKINPTRYTYHNRSDNDHNIATIVSPLGDTTTFVYYANDKLYQYYNSLGDTNTYRYNVFKQETTLIDPIGNESRVEFDTNGNIIRTTDALGATKQTKYDSDRNVVETIDAYGKSTYFNKDENGNPITISKGNVTHTTDRLGNVSRKLNFHPSFNKPQQLIDALGNAVNLEYDPVTGDLSRKTETVTLRKGEPDAYQATIVTESQYDPYGNLTSITTAKGVAGLERSTTSIYDLDENNSPVTYPGLNLLRKVDGVGNSVYFNYDNLDRMTSRVAYHLQAPQGIAKYKVQTSYKYDPVDRAIEVTDPSGNITVRVYDDNNRVFKEYLKLPLSGGSYETKYVTQHVFDLAGREIKTIDPIGNYSTKTYDAKGQLVAVTDALGRTERYEYDAAGRKIKTIDGEGNVAETTYDLEGRVIAVTDPLGNVIRTEYDAEGRKTKQIDELTHETTFVHDANGKRTQTIDNLGRIAYARYDELGRAYETEVPPVTDGPSGGVHALLTRYIFDELGDTKIIKAGHAGMPSLDTQFSYEYDLNGKVVKQTDAAGRSVETHYDENGNKLWTKDAGQQITVYTYDIMDRLLRVAPQDGNDITYTYDQLGNKLSARNQNVNYSYEYDGLLRLTQVKDWRFNKILRYNYDAVSNLTSMVGPEGELTQYRYDALNRPIEVSSPDGERVTYIYDPNGRLAEKRHSKGVDVRYAYNEDDSLQSVSNYTATGTLAAQNAYTYDALGLRESMTDQHGLHQYQYDAAGRLIRVDYPVSSVHPQGLAELYTYNYLGDRHSIERGGVKTYYIYDTGHRLQEMRSGSPTGPIQYEFAYDNNDNLIRKTNRMTPTAAVTQYQYDASDDMVGVTLPNLSTTVYKYGPDGNRVELRNAAGVTSRFFYDGDDELVEYNASGAPVAQYRHGLATDEILSVYRDNTRYYAHRDGLGSVVALSDAAGVMQATYSYDAFGQVLDETGTVDNPYGFTGRRLDDDTGLMYYRARYYDPEIGRFTQEDPSGIDDGLNLYAYVNNNPISKVDPTGLYSMWGGFGGFGGSRSGGLPIVNYSFSGYSLSSLLRPGYQLGYSPSTIHWRETPKPVSSWSTFGKYALMAASLYPPIRVLSLGVRAYQATRLSASVASLSTRYSFVNQTLSRSFVSIARPTVQQNRIAGLAGESMLRSTYGGAKQSFPTSLGYRHADNFVNGVVQESKVGFTSLSPRIRVQVWKDMELLERKAVKSVEWHFYPGKTGIGPTPGLKSYLETCGIKICVH